MIGRSEAWLSQVERGVRAIDRVSILERIAGALGIPLAELAPGTVVAAVDETPSAVAALRSVLSGSYALAALMNRGEETSMSVMAERVSRAWEYTHSARYEDLALLLKGLLPDLERAARAENPELRRVHIRELVTVYHAFSASLSKLGQHDAAWVATDRALSAAEKLEEPLLLAAGAFRLCLVFQGARQFSQVLATASTAAEAIKPAASVSNLPATSLFGALNLQLAVASARMNDGQEAYRYLDIAREAAGVLGSDRNDYETEFGPTNVRLHEVAVAVELGDAGSAIRSAESIDASNLSVERQARLLIDVARAWAQRRRASESVAVLLQAEALTPEQVRGHPLVETLVSDLLRMDSEPPNALADLAGRVGLT
jgi:transcriptional regulator with XRE-family HTH domain